jgi:hypothetical protein
MRSLKEYNKYSICKLIGRKFYRYMGINRKVYGISGNYDICFISWDDGDHGGFTDYEWDVVIDFFKSGVWILID